MPSRCLLQKPYPAEIVTSKPAELAMRRFLTRGLAGGRVVLHRDAPLLAHINQLNRYLTDEFGAFGVLVTRSAFTKAILRNTVDLWSGQRRCIICLTDDDLESAKQRCGTRELTDSWSGEKILLSLYWRS